MTASGQEPESATGAELFSRAEALLGAEAMERLAAAHVLVVGVGGVGSWCAEALVRTGVGTITLMDNDCVAASNVNRQCPATAKTVGRPKVDVMAERLRDISPDCDVTGRIEAFEHPEALGRLGRISAIVDAIDSVACKARLILGATDAAIPLVSSMGAALRTDPTQVRITRFEQVTGDGLARALRQRFKREHRFPRRRFSCVWSAETPIRMAGHACGQTIAKGSLMPVTATFGMCLASETISLLTKGRTA
ncbi:MAG: ThiF family adenylyltransferase [Kiritimatiellia bacterium]